MIQRSSFLPVPTILRLMRQDLALELETLRRPFVEPGEQHREGKPDAGRDYDPAHDPFRDVEEWKHLRCYLDKQPRTRRVKGGGAQDIATLQFGEETA